MCGGENTGLAQTGKPAANKLPAPNNIALLYEMVTTSISKVRAWPESG